MLVHSFAGFGVPGHPTRGADVLSHLGPFSQPRSTLHTKTDEMPMVMVEVEPLGFGLLGWRLLQTPPGVPAQPMLPFALVKINPPGDPHDRDPLRCNGGAGLVN